MRAGKSTERDTRGIGRILGETKEWRKAGSVVEIQSAWNYLVISKTEE
jgi:hypothetical protein